MSGASRDKAFSSESLPTEMNDGAGETFGDLVADSILPAPVKRNLAKAAARLCTAAIDLPIAYFEGKSAELRATTKERVNLIKTTSNQISNQMNVDPEYARRAVTQFGNKVLREQINLDVTVTKAVDELNEKNNETKTNVSSEEIDEDWLENFDVEARKKNSKEMQTYFAKILAGEITAPNSFSIKSLRILGNMDRRAAALFQAFCSNCMILSRTLQEKNDARMVSIDGNAASNSLSKYGFSFRELNLLNEYGLIISDYNSWIDFTFCVPLESNSVGENFENKIALFPFEFQGRFWVLRPDSLTHNPKLVRLDGVALTQSGIELSRVVSSERHEKYFEDLIEYFRKKKLNMVETPRTTPVIVQI